MVQPVRRRYRADINSTSASTNVDAYSTTNANSSYFSNGNGDPRTPGAAQVSTCANTTFADPKVQAECTAINQIAGDRSVRPLTPLTPADPMLVLGRATATDPVSVAGAFAASYSGCSTQTVTTPPIYETDLMHRGEDPAAADLHQDADGHRHRLGFMHAGHLVWRASDFCQRCQRRLGG